MTAFLTPFTTDLAIKVGGKLYRKKVLPVGDIEYEGQRVKFDRPFLQTLVTAFQNRAYDQVPFQLATAENKHNNDPKLTEGEVASLDLAEDGLYATVVTTDEGAKILDKNPSLGISARIVNGLRRADGRVFKAAMQHVLGTLDPMINGLGPWEAIEASHPEEDAINLTSLKFSTEEPVAPQFSDDELARLRALLAQNPQGAGPTGDPDPDPDPDLSGLDLDDDEDGGELTDEELNDLIAAAEQFEASGELDLEPELVDAAVDPALQSALLLTRTQLADQGMELARVTEQLADQQWEAEKAMFMDQYGIPPYILDLAEDALRGDGHVFEMSNGNAADAGAIVRRILTAVGEQVKILDLSGELGSGFAPDEAGQAERDTRADFVATYRQQTGI